MTNFHETLPKRVKNHAKYYSGDLAQMEKVTFNTDRKIADDKSATVQYHK